MLKGVRYGEVAPGVKREAEENWGRGFLYAVRGTHRRSKD